MNHESTAFLLAVNIMPLKEKFMSPKRKVAKIVAGSALGVILGAPVALAAFSPFVTQPDVVEIKPDERCVKEPGKLKCRWGGECAKVGNTCQSCQTGQRFQQGLGCYTCPQNTSLRQKNGLWICE